MSDADENGSTPPEELTSGTSPGSPPPVHPVTDQAMAPGGRTALTQGCTCSVLANAAFRAGAPDETPFIDPRCPLHALHVT